MKKLAAIFFMAAGLLMQAEAATAAREFSLVVAPARFSVIQVLFDVVDRRPAVLVSYQRAASTEEPLLHVWDGVSWNPLSLHALGELGFLERTPDRVILIGDDLLVPEAVRDTLTGTVSDIVVIRDLENASLLNELGRVFSWSGREWSWFAGRYNLDMEDEASVIRGRSWYDRQGPMPRQGTTRYEPAPIKPASRPATPPPAPVLDRPSDLMPPDAPSRDSGELDDVIEKLEKRQADQAPPVSTADPFPIK